MRGTRKVFEIDIEFRWILCFLMTSLFSQNKEAVFIYDEELILKFMINRTKVVVYVSVLIDSYSVVYYWF